MMPDSLSRELTYHQYLRERLAADFPDADEECLRDTLEGLTNLTDMLAEVLRSALDDQAFVTALRGRVGDMQARLTRIDTRARKKRDLVCSVMERADVRKLTEPDFAVSLRFVAFHLSSSMMYITSSHSENQCKNYRA